MVDGIFVSKLNRLTLLTMASKNSIIYLGFIDEKVNSKNEHHLNFEVSKIGGTPNWCAIEFEIPICIGCKRKMLLVIQLYAPLENSHYHRTIYLFSCITPSCWNRPHSWVCLRSQVLESKQSFTPQKTETTNEIWMDDQDDWGSSVIDDGNGNICPASQLVLEYMTLKSKKLSETGNSSVGENLNERKAKSSSHSITDVTKCMENKMNLNESDSNANDALCGAVGVQGTGGDGMEATAVIEGPEGDMIAVESPEQPTIDIPALFKEVTMVDPRMEASFTPYFIGTGDEPPEDTCFSEHERELFLRYTQTSGHELKEEEWFGGADGQGGDNVYEKMSAHHGDMLLHKFKKRVLRSPQQILRYCREEAASPLWVRPPNLHEIPPKCDTCGGRLTFEAQIMPQLIQSLRVKEVPGAVLEFGTVVLYTCLSSCWSEGDAVGARREFCYVQGEDD